MAGGSKRYGTAVITGVLAFSVVELLTLHLILLFLVLSLTLLCKFCYVATVKAWALRCKGNGPKNWSELQLKLLTYGFRSMLPYGKPTLHDTCSSSMVNAWVDERDLSQIRWNPLSGREINNHVVKTSCPSTKRGPNRSAVMTSRAVARIL